jgi:hypothetical protein
LTVDIGQLLHDWLAGTDISELAETHLAHVANVEFRFEQLGDFLSDVFEMYLPWTVATLISWSNVELLERGHEVQMPDSLPLHIRHGLPDSMSIELMSRGVVSRRLAFRVGEEYRQAAVEDGIVDWLRGQSILQWAEMFDASGPELSSLLDLVGAELGGAVGQLLETGSVALAIDPIVEVLGRVEVRKEPGVGEPRALGVWSGETLVGRVPVSAHSDLSALLVTGLPVEFDLQAGPAGSISLRVVMLDVGDPELVDA